MRARRSSGRFPKPKIDKVLRAPGAIARPVPERKSVLHYQVQEKLGQGGMGVVYRAVDKKLNRMVALKFLPPQLEPSSVDLERFLHEASALSALNHRHIATIYGVEDVDGQHFLVLEYLPGGTLKRKLQQVYGSGGVLSIDEILKYARQTAEGLAHAHSKGIIHRDVKTSNLMLTDDNSRQPGGNDRVHVARASDGNRGRSAIGRVLIRSLIV
jgi:serine/threonine protein kinase